MSKEYFKELFFPSMLIDLQGFELANYFVNSFDVTRQWELRIEI